MVGLIKEDEETNYRQWVEHFVDWCRESFLLLNTKKTKEIIFDFRSVNNTHQPLTMDGESIEMVDDYKYIGTIIGAKLS